MWVEGEGEGGVLMKGKTKDHDNSVRLQVPGDGQELVQLVVKLVLPVRGMFVCSMVRS
jgi:hypothetical protein